jgi:hypothetical protein
MEQALMNMKLDNERVNGDFRLTKEKEMYGEVTKLKVEIERREK